jgi:hypothetical protein
MVYGSGDRGPYRENNERRKVARREGQDRIKNSIFCSWRLAKNSLTSVRELIERYTRVGRI